MNKKIEEAYRKIISEQSAEGSSLVGKKVVYRRITFYLDNDEDLEIDDITDTIVEVKNGFAYLKDNDDELSINTLTEDPVPVNIRETKDSDGKYVEVRMENKGWPTSWALESSAPSMATMKEAFRSWIEKKIQQIEEEAQNQIKQFQDVSYRLTK